jgi:hypothetical protein
MLGLMILLLAKTAATPTETPEVVQPAEAASQVAACGFKDVRSSLEDDTLEDDFIRVLGVTAATEGQLRCVANASLRTHYYVVFQEPLDSIYQPRYWRLSEQRELADARAWLQKRGLLSRLPALNPKTSDASVVGRALEALCGPKAVGTLRPMKGFTTLSNDALTSGKLDEDTFTCLLNVTKASGYPLGFIGNEAHTKDH